MKRSDYFQIRTHTGHVQYDTTTKTITMTTHEERILASLASTRRGLHARETEVKKLLETVDKGLRKLRAVERELKAAEEKLAAYEGQMRYVVQAFDSDSYYCAPEGIVVDSAVFADQNDPICGCDSMAGAARVAAAMNRRC